jgi:protocatechuate 3,4-dioxygenase beta subunit
MATPLAGLVGAVGCGDDAGEGAESGGGTGSGTSSSSSAGESTGGAGSATTSGTTTPGETTAADSSSGGDTSGSTDGTGASSESESTGNAVCEPTAEDIEGPYYRPNIPVGGDLDTHGDAGVPLVLSGRVRSEACAPLMGAVVELWHASPRAPGGEPGDDNATYDDTAAYRYYGQVATDAEGRFTFTTLMPGWYLNGNAYRPAHLHVKVWVRDEERLTTQLYFEGDPFNEDDTWFNPDLALSPNASGEAEIELVV